MSTKISTLIGKSCIVKVLLGIVLAGFMSGCGSHDATFGTTWRTYSNERFGFEFPYPDRWVESIPPENRDGVAFGDPQNPEVEIRGWASYEPPAQSANLKRGVGGDRSKPSRFLLNFTTLQGVPGNLEATIGAQSSSLMLTLVEGKTRYYWRGSAPNQKFGQYYRLFNEIASRYRVPVK